MKTNAKLCFAETFSHSWVTGKYIALGSYSIGDVVTITHTSDSSYQCMSFSVKAGDTIQLKVKSGDAPRGYAILDVNNRLLEVASAQSLVDTALEIANDGKLIVNNQTVSVPSPTLVHKGVREPSAIYLNGYAKRVHLGADKVWMQKADPLYLGANQEMTWSATGSYINTNAAIGSVVSFTPASSDVWQYTIVSVKKGDVLLLTNAGGGTSVRAWALLDNSRKLLSNSDTGVTTSATPLTATADGYLVCNNLTTSVASPICKRVNPHKYDTVKIGNQVWMASNLDENIGLPQSSQWYYNNDKATYGKYGKLYTWTNLNTNLSAILPSGWRWATKDDFETLATTCGGSSVAGEVLKNDSWGWSSGLGTDEQNFGGVGGGTFMVIAFQRIGEYCYLWSATEHTSGSNAYNFILQKGNNESNIDYATESYLRSVRLVRDDAVYVLPTTTFVHGETAIVDSGIQLMCATASSTSLIDWTLFVNVTSPADRTPCYGMICNGASNYMYSGGYATKDIFCTRVGRWSTGNPETGKSVGKVAIRRKTGESYIQWSTDGKTWNNSQIATSQFSDSGSNLCFGNSTGTAQGTITLSAKLWDSAKEDIREYFASIPTTADNGEVVSDGPTWVTA